MENPQQINRRTWLARVAWGSFAVWSELNFGLGRKGWGVAIGGRDLAIGVAHAQNLEATKAALAAQGLTPALDITEVAPLGIKVMYYQDPEGNAIEIAQKL